jgi:ATP-dependent DNA ligase
VASSKSKAGFIEPTLSHRTDRLPEGPNQSYELLDGYRALAIKTGARVKLRSPNGNDFNGRLSGPSRTPSRRCPMRP